MAGRTRITIRRPRRRLLAAALGLAVFVPVPPGKPAHAAFPGQNGKIAFESNRDSVPGGEIYVMEPDGSWPTRITNNTAYDGLSAWSADGSKIAFVSDRDGNREIYVMNADGSGQTRLTSDPATDSSPAWSPDGSRIAFYSTRGQPNGDIYVMNADGSGQTRLTSDPANDRSPAWSPDGSKIAFDSNRDSKVGDTYVLYDIYVMSTDGSGQARLTANLAGDSLPAWYPDGSRIAFVSDCCMTSLPPGNGGLGVYDIHVMNADGTGEARLSTINVVPEAAPAVSPDGSKIAFHHGAGGSNPEIYVMNADGSAPTTITNTSPVAGNTNPDWGPMGGSSSGDKTAPAITSLTVARKFAASSKSTPKVLTARTAARKKAKRGATIRYTLSEAATVKLSIQRKAKRRRSAKAKRRGGYKQMGQLARQGGQGKNSVPFSGRIGKRKLAPGRYRLVATATDAAGNVSKPARRAFTIVGAT